MPVRETWRGCLRVLAFEVEPLDVIAWKIDSQAEAREEHDHVLYGLRLLRGLGALMKGITRINASQLLVDRSEVVFGSLDPSLRARAQSSEDNTGDT